MDEIREKIRGCATRKATHKKLDELVRITMYLYKDVMEHISVTLAVN